MTVVTLASSNLASLSGGTHFPGTSSASSRYTVGLDKLTLLAIAAMLVPSARSLRT